MTRIKINENDGGDTVFIIEYTTLTLTQYPFLCVRPVSSTVLSFLCPIFQDHEFVS